MAMKLIINRDRVLMYFLSPPPYFRFALLSFVLYLCFLFMSNFMFSCPFLAEPHPCLFASFTYALALFKLGHVERVMAWNLRVGSMVQELETEGLGT